MPPKKPTPKGRGKRKIADAGNGSHVEKDGKKAKSSDKSAKTVGMSLRSEPRKKQLPPEFEGNTKAKPAKGKSKRRTSKSSSDENAGEDSDGVSLTPHTSDDDFSDDGNSRSLPESSTNTTNSAVVDQSNPERGDGGASKSNSDFTEKFQREMARFLSSKKKSSKRKSKKKRKRSRRESSSSGSNTSGSDSESDSESSTSTESVSSDDSHERRRKRKRSKRHHERKRKGKSNSTLAREADSLSTVYTRGCKSPIRDDRNITDSESKSDQDILSNVSSDELINSLNSSLQHSTPVTGKRGHKTRSRDRDGSSDGEREKQREREHEENRRSEAQAMEHADEVIREIQQNKAALAKPSGELSEEFMNQIQSLVAEFKHFHLVSHVDKKLKDQIHGQDFTVEFHRLLPRSRARKGTNEQKMHLVHNEGASYFVPADKDGREISSYKIWEVAFKIFMGIFVEKWPERAKELLQYSHIIQTASNTYPWENVYNYDVEFREIMTESPFKHWGMISHQTWSLQLGEPVNKVGFQAVAKVASGERSPQVKSRKICWRFNKGRCNFGSNCEYDHRCSHCLKEGHGRHQCFKRGKTQRLREGRRDKTDK